MSDRIAIMQNGRFVEIGNAEDIYKNPRRNIQKSLLKAFQSFQ